MQPFYICLPDEHSYTSKTKELRISRYTAQVRQPPDAWIEHCTSIRNELSVLLSCGRRWGYGGCSGVHSKCALGADSNLNKGSHALLAPRQTS